LSAAEGHKLSVLALRGGGPLEKPLRDAGIEVELLNCGDGLKLSYLRQLAAALAALQPDLVHSHGEAALFYCGAQRLLSSVGLYRVCVSEDLANHCRDIEKVPDNKLHTVINGVDLAPYRTLADMPFTADKPVIGHVARLAPVKNQALLLDAFALVVQKMPGACLSIVGDGPERAALTQRAEDLDIAAAVEFHGETSDVPAKLADTHIFCLSSDGDVRWRPSCTNL